MMNPIQTASPGRRFSFNVRSTGIALLLVFLLLVGLQRAQAQINFTFDPAASQTGMPGQTLTYRIDLTNGPTAESLEGFNFTLDGNDLTLDSTPFESFLSDPTTPDPLPANYSLSHLSAFTVAIGGAAVPGTYSGTADITYFDGTFTNDVSQDFTVVVAPVVVPEPSALFSLTVGLLALLSLLYHRSKANRSRSLLRFGAVVNIALDRQGNIYVADAYNQRVQKFDKNGKFVFAFGSKGSGNRQFSRE